MRSAFILNTGRQVINSYVGVVIGGGAITVNNSKVLIRSSLFQGNSADLGGAVYIWNSTDLNTIDNSTFISNIGGDFGGAVCTERSVITIDSSTFINNRAVNYAEGGAVSAGTSTVTINSTTFKNNTAEFGDGAIDAFLSSNITIDSSTFIHNSAYENGAVSVEDSVITIYSSTFINNTATADDGGAIGALRSTVSIDSSTFANNIAVSGGAVASSQVSRPATMIRNCIFLNNTASNSGGAVSTDLYTIIDNSTFIENTARLGGAVLAIGTIAISDSVFINNIVYRDDYYSGHGGALYIDLRNSTIVDNCTFINNIANSDGGAVSCTGILYESDATFISLTNTVFIQNVASGSGGAIHVESTRLTSNGFLNIHGNTASSGVVYVFNSVVTFSGITNISNNYGSLFAYSSNVTIERVISLMNNSCLNKSGVNASTSQFVQEGGAVTIFQSEIIFKGQTDIMYNKAESGGAILATESTLYMHGFTTIAHNFATSSGGGIYAYQCEINCKGITNITANIAVKGGGIQAVSSTVRLLEGALFFTENNAERGGGACLELNTKLYVIKSKPECINIQTRCYSSPETWLRLHFTNNSADYGGALYIADDTNSGACATVPFSVRSTVSECFFQALTLYNYPFSDLNVRNIHFTNNSARKAGEMLFGGLLDRCTVSPFAELFQKYQNLSVNTTDAISYLLNVTNIQRQDFHSNVSSDSVRVCFCRDEYQPDCSYQPPRMHIKKGQTFKVPLAAVDQVNNTVLATVHGSLLSQDGGLREGQSSQNTTERCTELEYSILSPHDSETLLLYADGPCKDIGMSQSCLEVQFLPCDYCPICFKVAQSSCDCDCDPDLYPKYVISCSMETESVLRKDNVWISFINTSRQQGFVIYPNCPFDYCFHEPIYINLNTPNGADAQCAFNHSGKLCGACQNGLSLSLGSSHCVACSNQWLALLIPFAVAGIALVVFLLMCNLTVAAGTINGLLLYANIIAANRAIFLSFKRPNALSVFIAWFNLDFGFETCFYDGMDGYAKVWLQLVFPAYILFLVVMVIILAERSQTFAKFLSSRNPVATLATLILLSYAKLLHIIISALSFARLEYPDHSHELVWLYDSTVPYLNGKHIPLFIAALLILLFGVTYTLLLVFWQWLLCCPYRKTLRWIRDVKLNSFMDAYHAPYQHRHRYWTGLLLLVRVLLYLISAFCEPNVNLLMIICVAGGLLLFSSLTGRIYKNWQLNVLESSFIFNINIFAAATLYLRGTNGDQAALAYTSTSIAFVTFVVILIYHTVAFTFTKWRLQYIPLHSMNENDHQEHNVIINQCQMGRYGEVRGPLDLVDDPTTEDYRQAEHHITRPQQVVTYGIIDGRPNTALPQQ